MIKQTLTILMTFFVAVGARAESTLRNGDYTGQTGDGRACGIRVLPSDYHAGMIRIEFMWRKTSGGYEAGYVEVKPEGTKPTGNVLSATLSNIGAVSKIKLTIASDGTPLVAEMGLGVFFKVGYDETCLDLVRK